MLKLCCSEPSGKCDVDGIPNESCVACLGKYHLQCGYGNRDITPKWTSIGLCRSCGILYTCAAQEYCKYVFSEDQTSTDVHAFSSPPELRPLRCMMCLVAVHQGCTPGDYSRGSICNECYYTHVAPDFSRQSFMRGPPRCCASLFCQGKSIGSLSEECTACRKKCHISCTMDKYENGEYLTHCLSCFMKFQKLDGFRVLAESCGCGKGTIDAYTKVVDEMLETDSAFHPASPRLVRAEQKLRNSLPGSFNHFLKNLLDNSFPGKVHIQIPHIHPLNSISNLGCYRLA